MAENMIYNEFISATDRMDYIASTSNNYGFALAVEKLLDLDVPRRAKVIRMMLLELSRLTSHLFWLATHALDVGAMTIFLYAFREREYAMDLFEDYCGARLTHSAIRIGGVPLDLPKGWLEKLAKFIEEMPANIADYEGLLDQNRIWKMRLLKILKQLIPMYKETSPEIMAHAPKYISSPKEQIMTQNYSLMQHFVLVTQGMRPPVGEVYVVTESPKGELGFYINSQGDPYPYRVKLRAPSFWHTSILQELLVGTYLADVVAKFQYLSLKLEIFLTYKRVLM